MRRRFTRGGVGPLRRMLMGRLPPLLVRSKELMATARFAEAASGLEELARAVEGRRDRRAANLYLEAAGAWLFSNQSTKGIRLLKQAFGLLIESPFQLRLARSARRMMLELREQGLVEEAEQIALLVGDLHAKDESNAAGPFAARRQRLPTRWPGCGAPVGPDEVDWPGAATAEREYCATPLRAA